MLHIRLRNIFTEASDKFNEEYSTSNSTLCAFNGDAAISVMLA